MAKTFKIFLLVASNVLENSQISFKSKINLSRFSSQIIPRIFADCKFSTLLSEINSLNFYATSLDKINLLKISISTFSITQNAFSKLFSEIFNIKRLEYVLNKFNIKFINV